jgi:putative GTP pyrophosphokinase
MHNIREWKSMLIPYEQAVEELKVKFKSLRNEYRELNEYSPIEFVTGRVKRIASIIEKARRRDIPMDQIEDMMEDIAGLRIMCQFNDDIYRVVDLLRERDGRDLKIVYEKDYVEHAKDSGYRSYHVIIRYPVQTAFGQKDVLVELQIRTLAMNFWATIEHSLNYKYKSNIPDAIRDRLKRSARAAAALDDEMCEIRKEIIKAQLLFEFKSHLVSDITANIRTLMVAGRSEEAMNYQRKFEQLWDDGTVEELEDLLKDLKSVLPRYQLFKQSEHN